MIQLENRWTDLDEIWYGRYVIEDYPKILLYNFLQSVIPTAGEQTCEVGSTLAPLKMMYDYRFSENTNFWYSNSLYSVK
jgi:hypothetical protein